MISGCFKNQSPKATERKIMGKISGAGCLIILAIWGVVSWLMTTWTHSNLTLWLEYFKGEEVEVPMFLCWLITFMPPTFALNIISEIVELGVF